MFEDSSSKSGRKYVCFCCALVFDNFTEFTEHIIEEHEEGRDYIKCPLPRCKACVRDIRSHFAARHPTEPVPKKGLMKALIWKDVALPNGKMKTKKPRFKEGYYESSKMNKTFHFRSGWEETVYELLDTWNEIIAYDVEPFQIPYIHEGECHNYKPDLFIIYLDGHKEIWEVKPSSQTGLQKNKDKWFSAKQACEARGWNFEVITEQKIAQLKKTVKNQHLNSKEDEDLLSE